jgi:hypothetical protein
MTEIRIYGKLRKKISPPGEGGVTVLQVKPFDGETLDELLNRVGFEIDDIFTIFLNSQLFATHNSMARWLEYQQAREDPDNWDLSVVIEDGDRIGLFGKDMSALVV